MCVCVCVFVCVILFNPINPEYEIITISTNKIFKIIISHLHNPSKELSVNKIYRANNILFRKPAFGHIKVINSFPSY